jgi:hypothetical protein
MMQLPAFALRMLKRRAHPVWTGKPRSRRATLELPQQATGLVRALRSLRRAARRETPQVAARRIRAAEKRTRRRERNRNNPGLNWKASVWFNSGAA